MPSVRVGCISFSFIVIPISLIKVSGGSSLMSDGMVVGCNGENAVETLFCPVMSRSAYSFFVVEDGGVGGISKSGLAKEVGEICSH